MVDEDSAGVMAYAEAKSPKPPTAEEFKAMLQEGLANVAKKEQLDQMMTQIKSNSNALISLERKVDSTNGSNERRFRSIEAKLDAGPCAVNDDPRRAAYDKSRCSMRVWPIAGEDQDEIDAAFKDFAVEALQIPDTVVRKTRLSGVIGVRSSPNNHVYMDILVTFPDVTERDYYFSKARNLAQYKDNDGNLTAGVRMDIPPFLLSKFKMLFDYRFDIRNAHGKETC